MLEQAAKAKVSGEGRIITPTLSLSYCTSGPRAADNGKCDWITQSPLLKYRLKAILATLCFRVAANKDYSRAGAVFRVIIYFSLMPADMWSGHNLDVLPVKWWNNLINRAEDCPDFQTHPLLCFANFSQNWTIVTCLVTDCNPKLMPYEDPWAWKILLPRAFSSYGGCVAVLGVWHLALPHHLLYVPNSCVTHRLKDGKRDLRKQTWTHG